MATPGLLGPSLYAVAATSPTHAWAVGDGGTMLHTDNGGADWAPLAADGDSGRNLHGVDFLSDSLTGWAVGYAGRIMHTTDGGESWAYQNHSVSGHLWGVDAISATQAWAVGDGGVVLHTTTGGATWDQGTYSASEWHDLKDVDFLEDGTTTGWAVGTSGTIVRTDSGTVWSKQESGTTVDLASVSFVDANNGWVVGGGVVLHTTTGGADPDGAGPLSGWTAQTLPAGASLDAVFFLNQSNGWAVGDAGTIVHTADGGQTWLRQEWFNPGYTYPDLKGVWFAHASHGWAVGVPFGSLMLRTTDGGATWNLQTTGCSQTLDGVVFTDADHGWAVGWRGTILRFTGPLEERRRRPQPSPRRGRTRARPSASSLPTAARARLDLAQGGRRGMADRLLAIFTADPSYHSTDGKHLVSFFSTDNAGNREALKNVQVGIDTRRPWTKVLAPVSVVRGARASIPYRIYDTRPNGGTAAAVIRIKNAAGKIVRQFSVAGARVNMNLTFKFLCTLPRGVYGISVTATDTARNRQYSMTGQRLRCASRSSRRHRPRRSPRRGLCFACPNVPARLPPVPVSCYGSPQPRAAVAGWRIPSSQSGGFNDHG